MSVYTKLAEVQSKLKVSKDNFNAFGKYKYRSCEDILENVKPLLEKVGALINLSDEIMLVGDRYYIKATAVFTDIEDGKPMAVTAYAREDVEKKGMDLAQVTGSVSSYARKYALNGLLCIDDTKDSDATNKHGKDDEETKKAETPKETKPETKEIPIVDIHKPRVTDKQADILRTMALEKWVDKAETLFIRYTGCAKPALVPAEMFDEVKKKIQEAPFV